ncbi:hypothetical protein BDP67DRAFT_486761 [Colletotrichum lupini]|nr:hypothetical protein BDP67DRAFT_486761 [Colletotrichum lupini]
MSVEEVPRSAAKYHYPSFAVSPLWSSKANVKWLHTAIPHLPAHTKRHLAPMVSAHNDVLTGPNWAYPVATSGSRSPTPLQVASAARLGTDGEESIDTRLRGRRRRLKLREGWKKCLSSHHYHRPPSATDGPLELAPALACRRKSDPPGYHRSSSAPVLLLYTPRQRFGVRKLRVVMSSGGERAATRPPFQEHVAEQHGDAGPCSDRNDICIHWLASLYIPQPNSKISATQRLLADSFMVLCKNFFFA